MELLAIYKKLYRAFGPQKWWPAETPFEVIVGAILTQMTSWTNVEKAIGNLKKSRLLSLKKLAKASPRKVEKLIRPALYYRQKTKKLLGVVRYLKRKYNGNLSKLFRKPIPVLRKELLGLHGIGPETADSIVLYAAEKPIFVVDAYTRRIFKRLGMIRTDDYERIRKLFEENLPRKVKLYNEFHALIVELGKRYCRTVPRCPQCPLTTVCPKIGV